MKKTFYLGILILLVCWLLSMHTEMLPAGLSPVALKMAGLTVAIAIFWVTDTVPLGAASLLPLFLMPLMGIMPARQVASSYGSNLILLFMCGFFLAKGIERWNLHRRISLNIIKFVGTAPKRLILGFMVATALISSIASNTATCLMMLPIAIAAIDQFKEMELDRTLTKNFAACLMLAIAYGANIGGLTTPIASNSNIIFLANFAELFPDRPSISFAQWVLVSFPLVIVFLAATWLYLVNFSPVKIPFSSTKIDSYPEELNTRSVNFVLGSTPAGESRTMESSSNLFKRESPRDSHNTSDLKPLPSRPWSQKDNSPNIIAAEIKKLGKMSAAEILVAVLFGLTAIGWIFLNDLTIGSFTLPGWSNTLGLKGLVTNTTVAAAIAFIMFAIPVRTKLGEKTYLLDWETANKIPWELLLLFGSGIAISKGFIASGLSQFLTDNLSGVLKHTPVLVTIILVCTFTAVLTEFASNTAMSLLMLPICAAIAPTIGIDPLILMWTAISALKCTFCLPVATPPNAIVYSQKYFDIATMTKVGIPLNIIGIVLITLCVQFLAIPILFGV